MGLITLTFGKKCYSVTTPGDNLQISSTKRAFIECMFLTTQAPVTASGIFPWSDRLPTGIPVNEIRYQQSARAASTQCSAWRCCVALFDVNKPGPCITNVIATCRKNFSQWESSFLWKLRCHWLKFLRRVAKTLVIQGPAPVAAVK